MTDSAARVTEVTVLGAGALGLVASVLPWYGSSVSVLGFSSSVQVNAWHAGAGAWLSMLALVLAAGVVAAFGARVAGASSRWCWPLVLGLSLFSVICLIVCWANWPDTASVGGTSDGGPQLYGVRLGGLLDAAAGPGVGFYLGILASAVTTVASVRGVRSRGHRQSPPPTGTDPSRDHR